MNRAFGSVEVINTVLERASQRQGVQVIYGGQSYDGESLYDHPGISEGPYDRKTKKRISPIHITAVLPLGKYEQEQLLRKAAKY